jgi:two-component system sensor histidine kinase/response regulator
MRLKTRNRAQDGVPGEYESRKFARHSMPSSALNYLMRSEGVTPKQSARLDKIDNASQHLLSIINDVLDLSKIESGRVQLESTDFHLSAILDAVHSIIAETARAKGLHVEVDRDAVPLWLRGDQTRLRQALLNFAGNAVKFTERGSIALRAKLLKDQDDELLIRFSVEDTGIGIPADQIGRLFQAFEQADASTTRRFGGTGLGLSITQRLAQLMNGECGVLSTPGVGSTFWFTARLQRGRGAMPVLARAVDPSADEQLRRRHRGARVLLVEDNEVNREVALALLHSVGLNVDAAADGTEALALARTSVYDLVLMDVQMPPHGRTAGHAGDTPATRLGQAPDLGADSQRLRGRSARLRASGHE